MAQFDFGQVTQAMQAGRETPNRNTGLADLVKTITNDLKVSKAKRIETAQNRREANINLFKAVTDAGYGPRDASSIGNLIDRGDLSGFQKGAVTGIEAFLGGGAGAGAGAGGLAGIDRTKLPPGMSVSQKFGDVTVRVSPESATEKSARISRQGLANDITLMQGLFNQIGAVQEGPMARVSGAYKDIAATIGINPELTTYNDFKNAILGRVVITIGGESGSRLSDQDVKRMQNLFPNEYNTGREATLKWVMLKNAINETAAAYGSSINFPLTQSEQVLLGTLTPSEEKKWDPIGMVQGPMPGMEGAQQFLSTGEFVRMLSPDKTYTEEIAQQSVNEALAAGWEVY
jgi:hypothetical protein